MKTCSNCHLAKLEIDFGQKTSNKDGLQSRCRACRILESDARYEKYSESIKNQVSAYLQIKNQDQTFVLKEQIRKQKYKQTDHAKQIDKLYRKTHWQELLPKLRVKTAQRRAAKLKATPSWADHEKIKQIYLNCPKGHHVDHIVPLKGKNVSGLHVEYNLQYLPAKENLSKGNRI